MVVAISFTVLYYADWIQPKSVVLQNDMFDLSVISGALAVVMEYPDASLLSFNTYNLTVLDQVFVYAYNGVAGDNFQVYYWQQAATYVMPQTVLNGDGTSKVLGAPVAGLTNQQAWAQYGIAIAGAVAPASATSRSGIGGLVNPL